MVKSERFEMRLDEDVLERVDRWRGEQDDVPSRAEAMRRLIELGMAESSGPKPIRLTDGEKLLAMMMADLYRHLDVDTETGIDPEFVSEVITGGHYWALDWR